MKNNYKVELINKDGCVFDKGEFTNLKKVKAWACGRSNLDKYKVYISKNNDNDFLIYYTR